MRGMIFCDWGILALLNTKPGWPAEASDPGKPFKWQTRRVVKSPKDDYLGEWTIKEAKSPHKVGDVLYAKETLQEGYFIALSIWRTTRCFTLHVLSLAT